MAGNECLLLIYQRTAGAQKLLQRFLAAAPQVKVLGQAGTVTELERLAGQAQPDFVAVEYSAQDGELSELLGRFGRLAPRSQLIAVAEARDPETIVEALRHGVREFLTSSDADNALAAAVNRLWRPEGQDTPSGRTLAIMGVKGGYGSSHLALNLAWVMSQRFGHRVALVDLDVYSGNLSFLLDVRVKNDLAEVSRSHERLDAALMSNMVTEAAPGLRLLAAPQDIVDAEGISPDHVAKALDFLVRDHAWVVLDLPSRLGDIGLLALDRAETVLVVVEPTLPALKAANRLLGVTEKLGYGPPKMQLVVNRSDIKSGVPARDIKEILRHEVLAWLPNDTLTITESANHGTPAAKLHPKSAWPKAVHQLAGKLLQEVDKDKKPAKKEKKGLLR